MPLQHCLLRIWKWEWRCLFLQYPKTTAWLNMQHFTSLPNSQCTWQHPSSHTNVNQFWEQDFRDNVRHFTKMACFIDTQHNQGLGSDTFWKSHNLTIPYVKTTWGPRLRFLYWGSQHNKVSNSQAIVDDYPVKIMTYIHIYAAFFQYFVVRMELLQI